MKNKQVQTLLLIGGTSDAMRLAKQLLNLHRLPLHPFKTIRLIYTVAGLVRQPNLPCIIHSGGFQSQAEMVQYLHQQQVDLIIDASHPYALKISQTASAAATIYAAKQAIPIPYWHYERPAWQASPADDWHSFSDWHSLYPQLCAYKKPFFAWGREPLQHLNEIPSHQHWLVRTAIRYEIQQPQLSLIHAIGGFSLQDEMQLYQQYGFDVLICKNSGGQSVASKLQLARQLQLPILMQTRPKQSAVKYRFNTINAMIKALRNYLIENTPNA
jgi:precorrin-6A/cobalt-precorrin-6A reductase